MVEPGADGGRGRGGRRGACGTCAACSLREAAAENSVESPAFPRECPGPVGSCRGLAAAASPNRSHVGRQSRERSPLRRAPAPAVLTATLVEDRPGRPADDRSLRDQDEPSDRGGGVGGGSPRQRIIFPKGPEIGPRFAEVTFPPPPQPRCPRRTCRPVDGARRDTRPPRFQDARRPARRPSSRPVLVRFRFGPPDAAAPTVDRRRSSVVRPGDALRPRDSPGGVERQGTIEPRAVRSGPPPQHSRPLVDDAGGTGRRAVGRRPVGPGVRTEVRTTAGSPAAPGVTSRSDRRTPGGRSARRPARGGPGRSGGPAGSGSVGRPVARRPARRRRSRRSRRA